MFGSEGFDLDCSRVAAGRGDYVETKGTRHERHARDARVGGRPGRERPVPFTAVYYDGEGLRDGRAVGHLASDKATPVILYTCWSSIVMKARLPLPSEDH